MTTKYRIALIFIALPFMIFMTSEEAHQAGNPMEFIGKVVNFLVLFGGLSFLLYKPVRQFLEARAKSIDRSLKEAKASRSEAERTLEDSKKRLEELSREMTQMSEDASRIGKNERERIIKAAQEEAARIKEQAQLEIDMLSRTGIKELKEYAVTLAAATALENIRQKLTDQDHNELIDRSIKRLESLHDKASSG